MGATRQCELEAQHDEIRSAHKYSIGMTIDACIYSNVAIHRESEWLELTQLKWVM